MPEIGSNVPVNVQWKSLSYMIIDWKPKQALFTFTAALDGEKTKAYDAGKIITIDSVDNRKSRPGT
jgi:hypothetical protein